MALHGASSPMKRDLEVVPIAHGAARSNEPVREGLVAMLGPFIDTIVICSMIALVIIITGAYTLTGADGSGLTGADLTAKAFSLGLNTYGQYIVSFGLIFFAFSTPPPSVGPTMETGAWIIYLGKNL